MCAKVTLAEELKILLGDDQFDGTYASEDSTGKQYEDLNPVIYNLSGALDIPGYIDDMNLSNENFYIHLHKCLSKLNLQLLLMMMMMAG